MRSYLNLVEDEFIPQAVVSDDATAKLSFFPFGGEVQEPPLHCGVCLSKDLVRQEGRFAQLPRQPKPKGQTTVCWRRHAGAVELLEGRHGTRLWKTTDQPLWL